MVYRLTAFALVLTAYVLDCAVFLKSRLPVVIQKVVHVASFWFKSTNQVVFNAEHYLHRMTTYNQSTTDRQTDRHAFSGLFSRTTWVSLHKVKPVWILIPRLHDTTGCATGLTTGCIV